LMWASLGQKQEFSEETTRHKRSAGARDASTLIKLAPTSSWDYRSIALIPDASAQRTSLRPGGSKLSPQATITLGKRAATMPEKQVPLCHARRWMLYMTQLGRAWRKNCPQVAFNIRSNSLRERQALNCFALPAGIVMLINGGAIEAAANERNSPHDGAGVVARRLRHGTNQATKPCWLETGMECRRSSEESTGARF